MEEKTIITRHEAREYAFALLFAKTFNPDEAADEFYQKELANADIPFGEQIDYVNGVFFGVEERAEQIDELISQHAEGWAVSRIAKVTLCIMRLCIYEMMAVCDVPKRVALNEAVELAKKYGEDNAPSYVNGVLNAISHKLPERECDAD